MGGAKKPAPAKKKPAKDSKKGKKEKGEGGPKRAEITVALDDQKAQRIVQGAKVITVQELARQAGVKASAANAFFVRAKAGGTVKEVGGHSGHRLYQAA